MTPPTSPAEICSCGHEKDRHRTRAGYVMAQYFRKNECMEPKCPCRKFRPKSQLQDNSQESTNIRQKTEKNVSQSESASLSHSPLGEKPEKRLSKNGLPSPSGDLNSNEEIFKKLRWYSPDANSITREIHNAHNEGILEAIRLTREAGQKSLASSLAEQKQKFLDAMNEVNDEMLKGNWTPEQLLSIQHVFVKLKSEFEKIK